MLVIVFPLAIMSLQFLITAREATYRNSGCKYAGSFAGLGFLSLYLSGKIRVFDRRGHVAKLCIVFLPFLLAALIGVSRVDDYWHHWQDVFGGAIIGPFVDHFLLSFLIIA